jgi:myo-inositol-1(or 4)-monophosphatase
MYVTQKLVVVRYVLCYRFGMRIKPRDIIEYLLPYVVTAGAYSSEIQSRVALQGAKGGATIFHHALSDADLSIQSYLEVVLLARFPALSYFSEEQEQSLNKKYFIGSSHLEILIDPIDGTRPYIDNSEFYQIIITLHDEHEIVGSICYMPRRDTCFVATKGEGAYRLTREDIRTVRPGARWNVTNGKGPVLLFNSPELVERLSPTMVVKDIATAYLSEPGIYHSTDILEGKASAVAHRSCQAIDGGALAFIAAESGALVTDFAGNPVPGYRTYPTRVQPNVIVAVNRDVHDQLLHALR